MVALVVAIPAIAESDVYTDGNDIINWFDSEDKFMFNETHRLTRVRGVVDTLNEHYFCIPEGVPVSQLAAVVEKYLRVNPEKMHESVSRLVVYALIPAFPCQNGDQ